MRFKLLKNKKMVFSSFFIFLLALFLRLFNLNSISVFADEAIYIRWSQVMRAEETLRFLPLSDGKQPLFMWIMIPFLKIISDPLVAGRMVSVFFGLGTMIGLFLLTKILFRSYNISIVSVLVYAIIPFSLFFDRLALVDSLLTFFGVWTLFFSALTVQKIRLDTAMIAGFFLGGALLTKSPGIYFALLIPFTLLITEWPKKISAKFKKLSIYVFLFSFTYAIGFAMQNILRLGPNFHLIASRNADYVYPLSHIFTSPFDPLKPFLLRNLGYLWVLGTPAFVGLLVFGTYLGLKKFPKETLVLLLFAFAPIFISSEFSKTMTARYIYPSIPFFIVVSAIPFLETFRSKYQKLTLAFVFLFSFFSLKSDFYLLFSPEKMWLPRSERSGYLEEWTAGQGIREISEYLKNQRTLNPNLKIVVGTEGYFGTLPDGLQMYLNDTPEITIFGVGQPIREVSKSLIESRESGNSTYLVVNNNRLLINSPEGVLHEVESFPKAQSPSGQREKLILFEIK